MGMKFVVLVVVVLAVIAIAQIMRVYELSTKIRGKREEDIDLRTNNINASLMLAFLLVFFGSFFWMWAVYGNGMLPMAASEIGEDIDWLFGVNWIIIITVFLLTNGLLFIFAWKYAYDPNRRAHWFPHDNKLEMIWTVVPAGALAVIIILGLMTWNEITGEPSDDAQIVELYAKQFDWTARYSGEDNKLGFSDYKLVGAFEDYNNPLGVVTENHILWKMKELNANIDTIHAHLDEEANGLRAYSEANLCKMVAKVEKLERIRELVITMHETYGDSVDTYATDDFITKDLVLIKGQEYQFILRSQDVLHSAYFPHFRAQMNCVPGQRTTLRVTPTMTTQEMRDELGNQEFNYILMCNKICGVSHSNMKMAVSVVADTAEFNAWKNEAGTATMAVNQDLTVVSEGEIDMERMEMPEAGHGHGEEHDGEDHEGGEEHEGEDHGDHH